MTAWNDCFAVDRDPDRVNGSWVFRGTWVPVATLFENLRDGATIERFLEWFPGVERWHVKSVLDRETNMPLENPVRSGRACSPVRAL